MYQELLITSLKMKYIEYACKASCSMITTGHVEITFFFFVSRFSMLIFNVVFSMFIFNVDFRCWFSMLFLTTIFAVFYYVFDYIFFIILLALKLFFFIFYFLLFNLSENTFLPYIINFHCNIVFSPFFLFWLLISFVSLQFLFFSPQKLIYFTMIMLGRHRGSRRGSRFCLHPV